MLKKREKLDEECEFLRKQNSELKHLLLRYLPSDESAIGDEDINDAVCTEFLAAYH